MNLGHHCIYNEKLLAMDFAAVDSVKTQDLLEQVRGNDNWGGYGMWRSLFHTEDLLNAVFRIGGALALTVSLVVLPVSADMKNLQWLNHPILPVCFLAIMLGLALLAAALKNDADARSAKAFEAATFGNRVFHFFSGLGTKRECAPDIRMYEQEKPAYQIFRENNMFGIGSKYEANLRGIEGALRVLADLTSKIFIGILYLFVCLKAYGKAFGAGAVTQYISAVTALYQSVSDCIGAAGDIRVNGEFLRTCFHFLDIPNEMYKGSLTVEKRNDCNYEVEFCHVSFRYPDTEVEVLKDVNMKFCVGEKLAIVGENGSGKSTFIKLLCRLYDPTEGVIKLNGIDIKKYDYREYMSIFSVVFQDFKLLAFPLGANVAAGTQYDAAFVEACLEKAGFTERKEKMKAGMDTFLYKDFDEDGVDISGGEEQKIAIARALYQNAAFLILDEPTAALDPVAEYEIYTRLNDMVGERTAVYISHRLSSCKFCDEIVVFDHGQIVEQGSHEALLAKEDGKYTALWNAQAQYYVKNPGVESL
jgi:ATP-binding cassette subfamily B protein